MRTIDLVGLPLLLLAGCGSMHDNATDERKALAERYFRGVYGCEASVVDDLAAEGIVTSYPIFQSLFGRSALRGRDAARQIVENFCQTWTDQRLTIEDSVADDSRVVFLWSFQARLVAAPAGSQEESDGVQSWGGITLFRFDRDGKIVAEIGEESDPGPARRISNE